MDRERNAHWVARVVAWHNRHPLAERITPAQVQGLGYVDLPYSAPDASQRRGWTAVFSDDFLPPLRPRQVARWALRHGLDQTPRDLGQPVRQVAIDKRRLPPEGLALALWVGTAAIHDAQGRQTRVLLGPGAPHAVLGRRLWNRTRIGAASLAMLLLATLPALALLRGPRAAVEADAPLVATALPPGMTPAVAAVLAAAASAPPAHAAVAASAAPAAETAAPPASAPVAAAPAEPPSAPRASTPFPPRRPTIDEASKIAAQRELAAARAAQAAAKGEPVYAVATRLVRTRAESEVLGAALQQALVNTEAVPRGLRVETMPAGGDWRVVAWPLLQRADAERLREQLAARGQRIEIVAF